MARRRRCLLIIPTPIPPGELVRMVAPLAQTFDGPEVRTGPDQLEVWAFGAWPADLERRMADATVEPDPGTLGALGIAPLDPTYEGTTAPLDPPGPLDASPAKTVQGG